MAAGASAGPVTVSRADVEHLVSSLAPHASVLHGLPGWDPADAGGGDVDCAVPELDRSWPLGLTGGWKLCQCLHYDITGWYWVLERDGEVVRLDTLDDPRGIGRYGIPTGADTRRNGTTAPSHVRAAYLTSKRLLKGNGDPEEWAGIRAIARDEPQAYTDAVREVFGNPVGTELAQAVLHRGSPSSELRLRARGAQRHHRFRTPLRMVGIPALELARALGRIARPTGLVVLVAGPDGSGKSTLARALPGACDGLFRRDAYQHWSPGLLPRPGALLGRDVGDVSRPHELVPHGRTTSLALTGYHWLDFELGGLLRSLPTRARTGLVVMERGWWDLAVDPARYRLDVPETIVRFLGRWLPRPDLALVLEGPPALIHARKAELPEEEIDRQQQEWARVLPPGIRRVRLDASRPMDDVVRAARSEIIRVLEARAAGRVASGWVSLPSGRRPRWILPRGPRPAAKAAPLVYQPVTRAGLLGWQAARLLAAAGGFRLLPRGAAPPYAVRAAVAAFVPPGGVVAVAASNHPARFLALVIARDGECRAVVKVALDEVGKQALTREANALEVLAPRLPAPLFGPAVLGHEEGILALRSAPWRPRLRPWLLPVPVAEALGAFFRLGSQDGGGLGHGDFAPWNLLERDGSWTLVDWEAAREGARPFVDPLHYIVQSHALIGRPRAEAVIGALDGRGPLGAALHAYAGAAGLPLSEASPAFVRYLEESAAGLDLTRPDGRAGWRARRRLAAAWKDSR